MIDRQFLSEFKRLTESRWQQAAIDPHIYGFQFQPGTKWNPGLPPEAIDAYEMPFKSGSRTISKLCWRA
jgi:hypothetical protein